MIAEQPTTLSLEDLSREVANQLAALGLLGAHRDNRVSAVPDARTIRYYTTLGLLDRPHMDGRQARYGNRHLLQLLAIKALQGMALPLAEIQSRLYARSNDELESLLTSLAQHQGQSRQRETVRPLIWRELVIEPGLKLMVEDGWCPHLSREEIEKKAGALLAALIAFPANGHGGSEDDQPSAQ